MNVTVTIETTDNQQSTSFHTFEYDYESTKVRFMKKMAAEVKEQMGQSVTPMQMESMMRQSHSEAIFQFAVCSDWIIDNLTTLAKELHREDTAHYRVVSFELFDDQDVSKALYNDQTPELREMMTHMNRDFDDMIKGS